MENEINISSQQINSLMSSFGITSDTKAEDAKKAISDSLTPEQKAKINSVLSDPDRLRQILSSPQAKIFLNMIKDKKE